MSNLVNHICLTFQAEPGRKRGKNVLVPAFLQASLSSVTCGDLRERVTRPQMPNELCSSKSQVSINPLHHLILCQVGPVRKRSDVFRNYLGFREARQIVHFPPPFTNNLNIPQKGNQLVKCEDMLLDPAEQKENRETKCLSRAFM